MNPALLALSALLSTPSPAPTAVSVSADVQIDVGHAQWASFPDLRPAPRNLPTGAMLTRVESILKDDECEMRGQSHRRFDITVPWLVQVEPDGRLSRLVVADMGCRPLEVYVATLVVALAQRGDIRPATSAEPRIYASEFNFNLTTIR
ncbi:MAG TPA: hypothetical protein VEW25_08005 [Allosphingosinicella sp.]|nr:hypothetical protein [Allosphingosinicella sp.]